MRTRLIAWAAAVAFVVVGPACAWAQETSPSVEPTETYDLTFTLPTVGVSGCQVCHADPNLVKTDGATATSIYVPPEDFVGTAHEDTQCTGCHTDFAFKTPHDVAADSEVWRDTAKSACKDCHAEPFQAVTAGAHSPALEPGEDASATAAARVAEGKPAATPLCGDCHGSHDIQYVDVERWDTTQTVGTKERAEQGSADMHANGLEICGQCHTDYTGKYQDYYHGAAYQNGATDAPSCWDCHGTHEMLPADDRRSPVHPDNLEETCGECHDDVNEEYVEYATLVHNREEIQDEVFLYSFWESVREGVQGAFETVGSWFGGST